MEDIQKLFNECLDLVLTKYKINPPILKIGSYTNSYYPKTNIILLHSSLTTPSDIHPLHLPNNNPKFITLHELCHSIQHQIYPLTVTPHFNHNKKFYELCREFNLPYEHDEIISVEKKLVYNLITKKKRVIKENSVTNCPKCGKKKNGEYQGECPECTYPEEMRK